MQSPTRLELSPGHLDRATTRIAVALTLACLLPLLIYLQRPLPFFGGVRCETYNGSMNSAHCQSLKLTLDGHPWPERGAWVRTRRAMICADPSLLETLPEFRKNEEETLDMARETVAMMNRDPKLPECNTDAAFLQAAMDWRVLESFQRRTEYKRFNAPDERLIAPSTTWFWIPATIAVGSIWVVAGVVIGFALLRFRGICIHFDAEFLTFQGTQVALSRVAEIDVEGERIVLRLADGKRWVSPYIRLHDIDQAQKFCDDVLDAVPSEQAPSKPARQRQPE